MSEKVAELGSNVTDSPRVSTQVHREVGTE